MKNSIKINHKIKSFNKKITVSSDKSLSIRWALMASQAIGKSKAYNLLESEDVLAAIKSLKKLGVKIKKNKNFYEADGVGLGNFIFKNKIQINAENSGTFARLIIGILAGQDKEVKIVGDNSLSKRDFTRIIKPMKQFGVEILSNEGRLPLIIKGNKYIRPIQYFEEKGSSQVKSCIMLAALNCDGTTKIKCKVSRDHTEKLFKYLKIPLKVKKNKNYDFIEVTGKKNYKAFDYKLPGDISSSAFFIVLTLLSKKSKIVIKNVNVNKSRTGIIDILNLMGAKIKKFNKKNYKGEDIADIKVESCNNLKPVNCNSKINSRAIDEFLLIFLACAKAKGISYFKNIGELRHKECDRLKFAAKFLKMIGIKSIETKDSLKIYGNPNLSLNGKYEIKNYEKDHRVCMLSFIGALTLGGKWNIKNIDCINTSFPKFVDIIKKIGAKIN